MGLKAILKNWMVKRVPASIKQDISNAALAHINISYAQEGEDVILNRFLAFQQKGFYVDIGAHHPARFSNTYLFYKNGWNGINIDAMPGSMIAFNKLRPRDINIETPISAEKRVLKYFIFNETAVNTLSAEQADKIVKSGIYELVNAIDIETSTLSQILESNLPENQIIDFLTIDVEGLDFEILASNNWDKYQPKFILIEALTTPLENIHKNDIYLYLKQLGYSLIAKTFNTLFFRKD